MSAKEMFEQLGYGQIIGTKEKYSYEFIQYRNNKEQRWITFEFENVNCGVYDDPVEPMNITMQELQAINKQCEELGWNK